jgi:putative two-component system response regulator
MMDPPREQSTILIVDDSAVSLTMIYELLRPYYRTQLANNGPKALRLARAANPPDLILLDIEMPEMDGYQVCETLTADPVTREIPVLYLTARTDSQAEVRGFESGAVDYLTKPICAPTLLARVKTHLALAEAREFLKNHNQLLEQEVVRRTREIALLQQAMLVALGSLAETRDNETGNHIRRTQHYVKLLAEQTRDVFHLGEREIDMISRSAALHDIGKVGIPDAILLKPGKLTADEFGIMKTHTVLGRDTIAQAEKYLEGGSDFLATAREIAHCHHEKWDGSGYPRGLSGDAIPPSARLMAVADVYDALRSKRVYKDAFSHDQAVGIIVAGSGQHFDPAVVRAFESVADQFLALSLAMPDSHFCHE